MKLLFIGDIAWRSGREAVAQLLPDLRRELGIDFVIANGENAKHGSGLTLEIYEELTASGVDYFTSGDHIWKHPDFFAALDDPSVRVLRPTNYVDVPGKGVAEVSVGVETLTIVSLQGTVFMNHHVENPFRSIDRILASAKGFVFIDFHAEATSEKNTMGHYVDGRAGALVGTHTHVQTADERLLPKGTAYITDAGMTGPMNGSIGVDIQSVLPMFLRGLPSRFEAASGPAQLNGVVVTVEQGKASSIERVRRTTE